MANIILCGGISIVPYIRPVGIYQLANVLRREGYTVQVIDQFPYIAFLGVDYVKDLFKKFVGPETLWIGFGSTWFMRIDEIFKRSATDITAAKWIKERDKVINREQIQKNTVLFNDDELEDLKQTVYSINPKVKFVMGGGRAASFASGEKLIDVYIEGYADSTVVEYTKYLEGSNTSLQFRKNYNGSLSIIHDHKAQNFDYNNFKFTWNDNDLIYKDEMLPIEIARGCIFNCAFCSYPLNGRKKFDYMKDPKILREQMLENFDRFGTTKYFFLDDTLNDSPEKIQLLHDEVTEKLPFKIEFQAYLRLDLINAHRHTIELLKNMGIKGASFGVESLNYEANKIVGKGITKEKVIEISNIIAKEWPSVDIESQYIIGLPNDGEKEVREWLDIIFDPKFPMGPTQVLPLHLDKHKNKKNIWLSKFEMDPSYYGYTFPKDDNSLFWVNNKGLSLADAVRIREEYQTKWANVARRTWMVRQAKKLMGADSNSKPMVHSQLMAQEGDLENRIEFTKEYIKKLKAL